MKRKISKENKIVVTCTAPVNIAVIKYWGKRDEDLILPINSSLSGTIDQSSMKSTTTIMADPSFDSDRFWLNGQEEDITVNARMRNCLTEIRKRITDIKLKNGSAIIPKEELANYKIHIVSHNNFPTASGLASSASGFASLVFTLAKLYGIEEKFPGELTTIARVGSGSACRSIYGGFVKWIAGTKPSGEDSIAVQIAPETHWPMDVFILVVSAKKKTSQVPAE